MRVAPEDLRPGDFVAVLYQVVEFPSFFWFDAPLTERHEPVRMRCLPADGGQPLKVKAVCLPFVFAKHPCGRRQTLDVRAVQLARLDGEYARKVWKHLRGDRPPGDLLAALNA